MSYTATRLTSGPQPRAAQHGTGQHGTAQRQAAQPRTAQRQATQHQGAQPQTAQRQNTQRQNTQRQATQYQATQHQSTARQNAQRQAPQYQTAAYYQATDYRTAQRPAAAKPPARYHAQLPASVTTAYFTSAKMALGRAEQLYRDVASHAGISWKLLAACDWMQCQAQPRYSPVHGEKLGAVNTDGSVYLTKSEALAQCAADMIGLAGAVYGIDLTVPRPMSVRALAEVFAAFRWGGLLKKNGVSAMEFPYSVAGLTDYHAKMHWPAIAERDAPDKPGAKFKQPFGAVPVVLSLRYPATV